MKKSMKYIFNRMSLVGIAILIQFFWIYSFMADLRLQFEYANLMFQVMAIFVVLYIIYHEMNPMYKLSWTFILLLIPLFGLLLYILFGRKELTKKRRRALDKIDEVFFRNLSIDTKIIEKVQKENPSVGRQMNYLSSKVGFPAYKNQSSKYYSCGEKMFPDMLNDIEKAKHFIFLEYFIMAEGEMYHQLISKLKKKVKDGVEVRLIFDDFGCINNLPPNFYRELQKAGIKCAAFHPYRPVLSIIMNNRDHRKILVIDNEIAYTGGINIADEYINKITRFGYWKDGGVRITGESVFTFTVMFLEIWNYIVKGMENVLKYKLPPENTMGYSQGGYVQPYGDSPLDNETVGENVYLNMIHRAKEYVYIFTPYLIMDHEILVALCNAAKSGIDVRIVIPGIPDKKIVYFTSQVDDYTLINSGVKIYHYSKGFLHSKCFLCDDELATVGSINLDYRSLYLHFECGVLLYKTECIADIKEDMLKTFAESEEITCDRCLDKSFLTRFAESILRLFSPLM